MGQLDASIVTVALPHIGGAFGVGPGVAVWVSLAYLLVLVCALPAAGRLADRFGRKLLYVQGFVVFTAASLACGLAPDLATLIAARCVQGLGAALLQANSVALIRESTDGDRLGRGARPAGRRPGDRPRRRPGDRRPAAGAGRLAAAVPRQRPGGCDRRRRGRAAAAAQPHAHRRPVVRLGGRAAPGAGSRGADGGRVAGPRARRHGGADRGARGDRRRWPPRASSRSSGAPRCRSSTWRCWRGGRSPWRSAAGSRRRRCSSAPSSRCRSTSPRTASARRSPACSWRRCRSRSV